eukprot:COSAG03_NODE_3397_length_2040_cov_5.094796_3_plen_70_part_00
MMDLRMATTHTHIQRKRETEAETGRQMHRERERETEAQTERQRHRQRDRACTRSSERYATGQSVASHTC